MFDIHLYRLLWVYLSWTCWNQGEMTEYIGWQENTHTNARTHTESLIHFEFDHGQGWEAWLFAFFQGWQLTFSTKKYNIFKTHTTKMNQCDKVSTVYSCVCLCMCLCLCVCTCSRNVNTHFPMQIKNYDSKKLWQKIVICSLSGCLKQALQAMIYMKLVYSSIRPLNHHQSVHFAGTNNTRKKHKLAFLVT